MDEKIKELRSLPLWEFEKRFSEMYNAANEAEKDEIISSFRKGTHELISRIDSFIEETTRMLEYDKMHKLQYA